MADAFVTVARTDEIPSGEARVFEVQGTRVAVCNVDGTFYAIADLCTHDDGPLGKGQLDGYAIECPRHGARFDVRTGAVLQMPAVFPVKAYPTQVTDGEIKITLGE